MDTRIYRLNYEVRRGESGSERCVSEEGLYSEVMAIRRDLLERYSSARGPGLVSGHETWLQVHCQEHGWQWLASGNCNVCLKEWIAADLKEQ